VSYDQKDTPCSDSSKAQNNNDGAQNRDDLPCEYCIAKEAVERVILTALRSIPCKCPRVAIERREHDRKRKPPFRAAIVGGEDAFGDWHFLPLEDDGKTFLPLDALDIEEVGKQLTEVLSRAVRNRGGRM
jgi:hypothetical protein